MADDGVLDAKKEPTFDEIFEEVRRILVETLNVPSDAVTPEAGLIDDLGAESIDFIDIAFRLERAVGLKLPTREWGEFARKNRGQLPMAELALLLEVDYGVALSAEEQEELGRFGLKPICDRIRERYGVEIPEEIRRGWARRAVERNAKVFESLFAQTLQPADFGRLVDLASVDVYSDTFTRALRQLFTVRMLCRFIVGSLSRQVVEG